MTEAGAFGPLHDAGITEETTNRDAPGRAGVAETEAPPGMGFLCLTRDAGMAAVLLCADLTALVRPGDHVVIVDDGGDPAGAAWTGRFVVGHGFGPGVALTRIVTGTRGAGDLGMAVNLALAQAAADPALGHVVLLPARARLVPGAWAAARALVGTADPVLVTGPGGGGGLILARRLFAGPAPLRAAEGRAEGGLLPFLWQACRRGLTETASKEQAQDRPQARGENGGENRAQNRAGSEAGARVAGRHGGLRRTASAFVRLEPPGPAAGRQAGGADGPAGALDEGAGRTWPLSREGGRVLVAPAPPGSGLPLSWGGGGYRTAAAAGSAGRATDPVAAGGLRTADDVTALQAAPDWAFGAPPGPAWFAAATALVATEGTDPALATWLWTGLETSLRMKSRAGGGIADGGAVPSPHPQPDWRPDWQPDWQPDWRPAPGALLALVAPLLRFARACPPPLPQPGSAPGPTAGLTTGLTPELAPELAPELVHPQPPALAGCALAALLGAAVPPGEAAAALRARFTGQEFIGKQFVGRQFTDQESDLPSGTTDPTAPALGARAPLRVACLGRHAVRMPLAYPALETGWAGRVTLVDPADPAGLAGADLILFAHPQDPGRLPAGLARTLPGKTLALMSEEPFWDSLFSPDPLAAAIILPVAYLGPMAVHQVNHHTSAIFAGGRLPYQPLTEPRFALAYARLFPRNAGLSAADWQAAFAARPLHAAFMAERRPEAFHDMTFPRGEILGLCAWRTRLAEGFAPPGAEVARFGASWQGGPTRFALTDWHADKLARLDGKARLISAIENTHQPGYMSEKLFDAFACGGRPLYLASPGHRVHDLGLPPGAWINLWPLPSGDAPSAIEAAPWDDAFCAAYAGAQARLAAVWTDANLIAAERARIAGAVLADLTRLVALGPA